MRLDINLATHPYEDAREFWIRWGSAVGVLALLTLLLVGWTVRSWINAGRDRQNIAQIEHQISSRDKEKAEAQALLNMSANRSTRDQSQFLNGLIRRKSFSWTLVFEDLEQVMPRDLHVVSLQPKFTDQNTMLLDMKVIGTSRAAAVELVHRMETSRHFQNAQLVQESASDKGEGVIATVESTYVPEELKGIAN
jgi:type IV pilus assembly protein PilN